MSYVLCVQPDLTFVDILYYDMVAESGFRWPTRNLLLAGLRFDSLWSIGVIYCRFIFCSLL